MFILEFDCSVLPVSVHSSQKDKKGCEAAVWSGGSPSRDYCTNTGQYQDVSGDRAHFQWWTTCCDWKDDKCVPKSGNYIIYVFFG